MHYAGGQRLRTDCPVATAFERLWQDYIRAPQSARQEKPKFNADKLQAQVRKPSNKTGKNMDSQTRNYAHPRQTIRRLYIESLTARGAGFLPSMIGEKWTEGLATWLVISSHSKCASCRGVRDLMAWWPVGWFFQQVRDILRHFNSQSAFGLAWC